MVKDRPKHKVLKEKREACAQEWDALKAIPKKTLSDKAQSKPLGGYINSIFLGYFG